MFYRLLFFFFLLFALSCSNRSKSDSGNVKDSVDIITINVNQTEAEEGYQSIFSSVDTLLLEENEKAIVGEVDKVVLADPYIFVLDRKKAREVFMYHTDGSFIRSIGSVGAGVGEFISPDGVCVDSEKGEVIVVDKNNKVFLFYGYDGRFIRSITFDGFINDFTLYGNNKLIIDSGNMPGSLSYCLTVVDKQSGKVEREIFPKNLTLQNMPFMSLYPLTVSKSRIVYQPPMSNSIYDIYNDSISLKYEIDFGKYWPDTKDLEQLKDYDPNILVNELKKKYVLFPSLLETDGTIFVCFSFGGNLYTFFKDKKSGVQKTFIWDKNSDLSLPIGVVNNQFISVRYNEALSPMLLFYNVSL